MKKLEYFIKDIHPIDFFDKKKFDIIKIIKQNFPKLKIISKGDRIAVTGLSGSGKTTFIHILIGLIKQQSGEIFIDKKKITSICNTYIVFRS